MEATPLSQESFLESLRVLFTEAYLGPPDPRGTWFVDNEPNCGFVGILDRVTAAQASVERGYPAGGSIAAHGYHIQFALDLVIRASRGDQSHQNAKWSDSWARSTVSPGEWDSLRADLRQKVSEVMATMVPGPPWADPMVVTSAMGVIAHGAWHLGAIRQLAAGL